MNRKRKMVVYKVDDDDDEEGDVEKTYKFNILLPNGVSVGLRLSNPKQDIPLQQFMTLVKEEYYSVARKSSPTVGKASREINWHDPALLSLKDANNNVIKHRFIFANFNPNKCHCLLLDDGKPSTVDTYENMWDLTPDTELLRELPEEYTFETALADLIDNSLQAVWFNANTNKKLISIDIMKDRISIFDSGPGMDDSDENSLVKWGRIGASLNRSVKAQGIGGDPPYLMPAFGMFGYGGAISSMYLGRRAVVSSKRKESRKVYTLHFDREVFLNRSSAEPTWKTRGCMRDPFEDEKKKAPYGSFTKVDILEPKMENLNIYQIQCKLKDIYFPYIQCDDMPNQRKTSTPIQFQVNDVDLAEIEGGEVSITNLHSCNGPDFVFQLRFSIAQDNAAIRSPGLKVLQEANARIKCVYFPFTEGKENIERILNKLETERDYVLETYRTFSRVSIRRLGRLIPDARWACLPFMECAQLRQKKADLLKRCCLRVKCFIETDAGFNPTPSKTDLAHCNPFTIALKGFGDKRVEKEQGVSIEIFSGGKQTTLLQLGKDYQDWILRMHDQYDEEFESGQDDPVLIIGPQNKEALGITSDVVRAHEIFKRRGAIWKRGQKIKIARGACAGCHKNNVYATIEYFLIEGFPGDTGGEARILCRQLGLSNEDGCLLVIEKGNASLDVRNSFSVPISVIDSGKCQTLGKDEWQTQLEKHRQKGPSTIELLSAEHCEELDIDGPLPVDETIHAGQVPPMDIVAIVRPGSYVPSSTSKSLDQKFIVKTDSQMSMRVGFRRQVEGSESEFIYSNRVHASRVKGISGAYTFPLGSKLPDLFQRAGVYTLSFSLVDLSDKKCEREVSFEVCASSEVGKWKFLSEDQSQKWNVRVGSSFPTVCIACLDIYDNRIPFACIPKLVVTLNKQSGVFAQVKNVTACLSSDKLTLEVKDIFVESNALDVMRPNYEATLVICPEDNNISVVIPCKVTPGPLHRVEVLSAMLEEHLLPGSVVKEFILEMFDAFGNHVMEGSEVQLKVDGFCIRDRKGSRFKVDDNACIDLSYLLEVTAGFGETVSVSVSSHDKLVFSQEFQTGRRELKLSSMLPEFCTADSQLENIVFNVVDPEGVVDAAFHDEKGGQSHMLTIKSDFLSSENYIRYAFRHGCCTVPSIPMPPTEGRFCFTASHFSYHKLQMSFEISVTRATKGVYDDEILSPPCSDGKVLLLENSSPHKNVGNFGLSIVGRSEGFEDKLIGYGSKIRECEEILQYFNDLKGSIEQDMSMLQVSIGPNLLNELNCLSTKEKVQEQIESRSHAAAVFFCKSFREDVVGPVAVLGAVHTNKLSRMLAEYMGEDQMLAVVCQSYETACALEKYEEKGDFDGAVALHAEAVALDKSKLGRFLVICLEDIRPYTGKVEDSDQQRKLLLPDPDTPGGVPSGFLGYAVNMIDIDPPYSSLRTSEGHGLRETLFYRLLGELQVYDTKRNMKEARAYIRHGAISLDGGILRENGIISLGHGNPVICFPVEVMDGNEIHISPETREMKRQLEVKKVELQDVINDIQKATTMHEKAMKKFRKTHRRYDEFLNKMEPVLNGSSQSGINGLEMVPQ